MQVWGD